MILFQLLDIINFIYLECNTIEYDFKISATKFPGKIYAKYLRNNSKTNFGGLLGLFVGMSFLSFGELIQIIIEVLIILFEKNKVRN